MLVEFFEILEPFGLSVGPAVSGGTMKLATLLMILALITAPACGGGGGGSDPGGSPSPLAASFVPTEPAPAAKNVAMAEGTKTNDVVTVKVTLTDTNDAYGTAFDVVYDDVHTAYLGFSPGTVFEQGGITPNYTVSGANSGRVVVAVARTGATGTNVSGTKTMVSLQFRVKQAGVYPVSVAGEVVYDSQSIPQPIAGVVWFTGAVKGL